MLNVRNSTNFHSFLILIFVSFLIIPAQAQYSGGTGEPNNPYQIATAQDLMLLGDRTKDYDKHFIMTDNIDLDPNLPGRKVFNKAVIGTFKGVFDGNNNTISNLNIQGSECLGLFKQIDEGEVRNLGMLDVNIVSSYSEACGRAGSIASCNYDGYITGCSSTGSIRGTSEIGGIVGYNQGYIKECYTSINILESGVEAGGGLVGKNHSIGTIISCCSTGNVTCTSPEGTVGGLVGYNDGVIIDSYSNGNVHGNGYIGGLVGISEKYSLIQKCYSTGQVTGNDFLISVGGLIGFCSDVNICSNSFWDIQTSCQTTSEGGIGATTEQMQDPNTFRIAGWDFVGPNDGPSDIWAIPETGGYPILWWQLETPAPLPVFSGGLGTETDPYLIATADDLNDIGSNPRLMNKHFKLIQDINLANEKFYSIGLNYPFEGVCDGNGHRISNFKGTADGIFRNACPFYEIGCDGIIKNIGIEDVNIIVENESVGALVGTNYGTVINSYSTGNIYSNVDAGGLVCLNSGTIKNCYSHTNLSGPIDWYVKGGLAAMNMCSATNISTIKNCYATGKISGSDRYGLVGSNIRAYVYDSFWDIETSGQKKSYGGTGKTTSQMQTESTFTNAGWDFAGEITNGTEDIWWIDDGNDYPRLWWECETVRLPVIELDSANFYNTITDGVILVDFYATWCSHCTTQAPILEEVADMLEGRAQVGKLDVDKASSIVQLYGINAVPTIIVFRNGIEEKRFVGVTYAEDLVVAILETLDSTEE